MNNFSIVKNPVALPAICMTCGVGPDRRDWFLDFDRQEEFYGAQYICNICMGHLVEICGFGSAAKVAGLNTRISELLDENFELRKQVAGLRKVESGLLDLGLTIGGSPSLDPPDHEPDSVQMAMEFGKEGSPSTGEHLDVGTGTPPESSEHEDLGKLHANVARPDFKLDI